MADWGGNDPVVAPAPQPQTQDWWHADPSVVTAPSQPVVAPEQQAVPQWGAQTAFNQGMLSGLPIVGPLVTGGMDRAAAGIQSLYKGTSYADELAQVQARTQAIDAGLQQQHPVASTAGHIAGGIVGTIPMAAAAPEAFGISRAPMLERMFFGGLSGGGIGGTDAAVRSGGDPREILLGAGTGLAAGALSPVVAEGVGAAKNALVGQSDALSSLSGPAQKYALRELADPQLVAVRNAELARLGPDATLADVSPEWLGVARGAASRPGSRDAVVNALLARQEVANQRLGADIDAALGPAPTPSQIEASLAASRDAVAQAYGPIMAQARAVNTQPLANALDAAAVDLRGPAQQAVQRVRGYLDIPGTNQLDPNPQALLATRQAIDGLMANETNPQVIRQLAMARQTVDQTLAQAAPGIKAVDAQFAELARQSAGLERGRNVLTNERTAIRPQDLAQEVQAASLPQGQMTGPSSVPFRMAQGARAEIDRAVGTKANDVTALRLMMRGEGDWNRAKLETLFGPQGAQDALAAIDREAIFGDTANRVTRGSDTAMAARFGDFLDSTGKGRQIPVNTTMWGTLARGGQNVANAILQRSAAAKADAVAQQLGALSVAQGPALDAIVQALMTRSQPNFGKLDPAVQAVIAAVMQSGSENLAR